jgi:hypothetical protein
VALVTLGEGGFGNIRTRSFKICVLTGVLKIYISLIFIPEQNGEFIRNLRELFFELLRIM